MATVTIAGEEKTLQPFDAARAEIVGALIMDAQAEMRRTIATFQELLEAQKVTLTEEMLASPDVQAALDNLNIPEEERVPGLKLDRYADPTRNIEMLLGVAVKEVPNAIFNIASAMLIPNAVLAKHYSGSDGQKLKEVVEKGALKLRFGTEENDHKGIKISEAVGIVLHAVQEAMSEVVEAAPLGMELLGTMGFQGLSENSSADSEEISATETSGETSSEG